MSTIECPGSPGNYSELSYHIHSFWKNQTADSSFGSFCGASATGLFFCVNIKRKENKQ
jgi:hypothetical protein